MQNLITFPANDRLPYSVGASWSIFHPASHGHLFVLEPEEASCIDILEPVSGYHIALCQGDKQQCQGWINRHFQLPPEDFFKLETDGKACVFRDKKLHDRRLIIIWLSVPPRDAASCVFSLLAHEALHAAYALMDGMGMTPDFANEEWTAYMIQFLMNNYTGSIGIPVPITD